MIQSMGEVSFLATDKRTKAKFNFSEKDEKGNDKIVFQNTKPNFEVKANDDGVPTSRNPYIISTVSDEIVKKLTGNEENYKKYFSDCNKKHHESDGASLTLYFQFTLKGGYALEDEVAHITSEGLSIQLILSRVNSQTWE